MPRTQLKTRPIITAGGLLVIATLFSMWLTTQAIEENTSTEQAVATHSAQLADTLLTIDLDRFETSSQRVLTLHAPSPDSKATLHADATRELADIARLAVLTADNPPQTALAKALLSAAELWIRTLRRQPDTPAVIVERRQRIGTMIAIERELLAARTASDGSATPRLNQLLKVVLGLAGLSTILALWAVYHSSRTTVRAAQRRLQSVLDRATDAIFVVSRNGVIRLANAAATSLFRIQLDEFPGRSISDHLAGLREGGHEAEGVRGDGTRFPSDVSIGRSDLRVDETVYIVRDLSERKAAEASLRRSQEQFQVLVQGVKDYAIYLLDPQGRIASWNSGAQKIKGYLPDEILGEHFSRFYTTKDRESGKPQAALNAAEREGRFEDDGWRVRKDGSRFWANGVLDPIRDMDGTLLGFAKVTRDNTERHHLDRLKTDFISTVSHELRTPLTSIRGSLGLVVGSAAGELPPMARRFLEIAYTNCGRLIQLVNDILDIESIESEHMAFQRERIAVRDIIDQAMEANQAYADEFGVTFRVTATLHDDGDVFGDMLRIQQVMSNLLSNAAKFSPAGGYVEVAATAERDAIRIAVRDRGEGIPIAFRHRIFQRFAQADSSDQRQKGGTGLGLSISKAIVEQHGGSIGWNDPKDGGTEFWFTLERMPVAPKATSERQLAEVR